jgi:hypothetical protein
MGFYQKAKFYLKITTACIAMLACTACSSMREYTGRVHNVNTQQIQAIYKEQQIKVPITSFSLEVRVEGEPKKGELEEFVTTDPFPPKEKDIITVISNPKQRVTEELLEGKYNNVDLIMPKYLRGKFSESYKVIEAHKPPIEPEKKRESTEALRKAS